MFLTKRLILKHFNQSHKKKYAKIKITDVTMLINTSDGSFIVKFDGQTLMFGIVN